FHLASIYRKLGVMNRTEAAGYFFQHLAHLSVEPAPSVNGNRSEEDAERRRQALSSPPMLDLAFAAAEDGGAPGRGRAGISFGSGLTGAVLVYAAGEHIDVGTLVLAAFGALLHRYTGQPELVLSGATGPLWIDAGGAPSFAELVRRVHCELVAGTARRDED